MNERNDKNSFCVAPLPATLAQFPTIIGLNFGLETRQILIYLLRFHINQTEALKASIFLAPSEEESASIYCNDRIKP
jgi:hypothetical protein